jgi:hypothetical protein
MKIASALAAAAATVVLAAAPAMASVSFDSSTGTGFVGKGDVQLAFGWNNKALQDNASNLVFSVSSTEESQWTCVKMVVTGNGSVNEIVQERSSTTTTEGIAYSIARENSKGKDGPITGFILNGYNGGVTTSHSGPAVGSCPNDNSEFVEGSVVTENVGGGGLSVTFGGTTVPLPNTPVL